MLEQVYATAGLVGFLSLIVLIAWKTLPSQSSSISRASKRGPWGVGLFSDRRSCRGCKNLPGQGVHALFQFGWSEVQLKVRKSGRLTFRDRFGPLLVLGRKDLLAVAAWHSCKGKPVESNFSTKVFDFCYETCSCGWENIYFEPGKMMVVYIPWLRLIFATLLSESDSRPIGGP